MKKNGVKSGTKPLSFYKYYRNNLKKTVTITLALIFSVFMVIIFQSITYAVNEPTRLGDVGLTQNVTLIYPSDDGKIDNNLLESIKNNPLADRLIPVYYLNTYYNHFFGTCNIMVLFPESNEFNYIFDKLKLKLIQGKMPQPGKREIIIDYRLAKNKNKKLGDYIGKEVNPGEKIPGKFKVVGITDGSCITCLSYADDGKIAGLKGLIAVPKENQLDKFNLEYKDTNDNKANIWSKDKAEKRYNQNAQSLNKLFGIMSIAVIFVISFASGNSSYAQYFSRRYEFGILQSLGFTKAQILLRAAKEICLMNITGFIGGIALGLGAGFVLGKTFFEPHGYPFVLLQQNALIKAVTIPVCTAIFGLIPAGWLLSKIDPLTVVEKFE
ncbi:MAG: ABC transporter permease [Bacillota bacterium]|nr:ABC transporter permease [Bacillota bacterium]